MKIIIIVGLLIIAGTGGWFLSGVTNQIDNDIPVATVAPATVSQESLVTIQASDFVSVRPVIAALPEQTISEVEREGLIFMREEEKLARDVYSVLYDTWGLQIFSNIAQSEQTHTEAVRTILAKYNIADPVIDDTVGVFVNANFQTLYTNLTTRGMTSIEEALSVGALIEDLDIADLQKQINQTDNEDIKLVYENLQRASRNHLRSFVSQLVSRGGVYKPQYITQSEFDTIVTSSKEPGSGSGGRGWGRN